MSGHNFSPKLFNLDISQCYTSSYLGNTEPLKRILTFLSVFSLAQLSPAGVEKIPFLLIPCLELKLQNLLTP